MRNTISFNMTLNKYFTFSLQTYMRFHLHDRWRSPHLCWLLACPCRIESHWMRTAISVFPLCSHSWLSFRDIRIEVSVLLSQTVVFFFFPESLSWWEGCAWVCPKSQSALHATWTRSLPNTVHFSGTIREKEIKCFSAISMRMNSSCKTDIIWEGRSEWFLT